MPSPRTFLLTTLVAIVAVLYRPVNQRLTTCGVWRSQEKIVNIHGHDLKIIPNTIQCEDIHHHLESNLLFAACQGADPVARLSWFPPLGIFGNPANAKDGGLFVINPDTFVSTELKLEGFSGPFVTHGIDVITDPQDRDRVFIFAINHLPNPLHYLAANQVDESEPKGASQIEIFTHKLGSENAQFQRSVRDRLITTPNDIFATSPNTFYVTNDHFYREGFMRLLEDALEQHTAPWSDIVHVTVHDLTSEDATKGQFTVKTVRGLHNNNGLGHGSPAHPEEMLIVDASGGVLHRGKRNVKNPGIKIVESIQVDTTIDNPSWYEDPYKNATHDASGYVLAGLLRAMDLSKVIFPNEPVPPAVTFIRSEGQAGKVENHGGWEKRIIFQDNSKTLRSASAAVIVGIDPKKNGGKKQGWLFVTGFVSEAMVAAKIDL